MNGTIWVGYIFRCFRMVKCMQGKQIVLQIGLEHISGGNQLLVDLCPNISVYDQS